MRRKNEVAHYPEITNFIEAHLNSNFRSKGIEGVSIYWKNGELTSKIKELISENTEKCACLQSYCRKTPPLNLDIFGVITDGKKFEIIVLEIKLRENVGLAEWSQLVGYCLVSGAKYGLLVNIDNGGSPRLMQMLQTERHISHIHTLVKEESREHLLGFMQWNSLTHNFEYSNLGIVRSLSELSGQIADGFK